MSVENKEEVKIPVIGEFKPKRKYIAFVSALKGTNVRLNQNSAFIEGKKLSGMFDDLTFKITICDEGTINFEEVDTSVTDKPQRQRLLDDIDVLGVSGYAQKFVVSGLEFADMDGNRCYLEVEHKKPIDVLKSLFDDEDEDKPSLSEKGASLLDELFGDSEDNTPIQEEDTVETNEDAKVECAKPSSSYLEESFKKINDAKIAELKQRILDNEKESSKLKHEIGTSEAKLKKLNTDLGVLESRLDSFGVNCEPNGYVFYVSEEQKPEDIGITDDNKVFVEKIADLLGLKKDALLVALTEGYYKIIIAKKDDIAAEKVEVTREIYEKMKSITSGDVEKDAKIKVVGDGQFEYRGSLTWHQIVKKMLRNGFEQSPDFDKQCESNSYKSHEENLDI